MIGQYVTSYYRIKQAHELGRTEYLALSTEGKNSYSGPVAVKYTWKQLPFSTKRRLHCDWLTITLLGILSLLASSVYQLGTLITWMSRLILLFIHRANVCVVRMNTYCYWNIFSKVVTSLACMLMWSSSLQFIQAHKLMYAVVLTLSTGIPRMATYFIGVVPVFLAICFVFITVFATKVRDVVAIIVPCFR
jgi:hypothetical protein